MDILVIHSLYIPYIFPRYVRCIFPCVFLNLWSQEKTSPYHKATFLLFKISSFTTSIFLLINLLFFIKLSVLLSKFITFYKIIGFTNRIYSFFIKSSVLLSKFTKTSPYNQTTFLLLKFQGLRLLYFY